MGVWVGEHIHLLEGWCTGESIEALCHPKPPTLFPTQLFHLLFLSCILYIKLVNVKQGFPNVR